MQEMKTSLPLNYICEHLEMCAVSMRWKRDLKLFTVPVCFPVTLMDGCAQLVQTTGKD